MNMEPRAVRSISPTNSTHDRRIEHCSKLAHDLSFRILDPKHHGRLIGVFTHVPTAWNSFGHVASRCLEFEQAAQGNNRVIETGILGSLFRGGGNNKKMIGHVCRRVRAQRPNS